MVVLKQYGEKRTGTNYLRALLVANYHDVLPLMHVLGDKHSAPVDAQAYWEKARNKPKPTLSFVTSATWAVPAETTSPDDAGQLHHLGAVAEAMTVAFDPGKLGFLISVKHPYSWAASLARYNSWLNRSGDQLEMGREHRDALEAACCLYNLRHRAWLDLHLRSGERSQIIRYERLLEEPRAVLTSLERRFSLHRSGAEPILIAHRTAPTHWDNHPMSCEPVRFNPNPYRDRAYQYLLCEDLWAVVRKTIDWELAVEFGYQKFHFHGSPF